MSYEYSSLVSPFVVLGFHRRIAVRTLVVIARRFVTAAARNHRTGHWWSTRRNVGYRFVRRNRDNRDRAQCIGVAHIAAGLRYACHCGSCVHRGRDRALVRLECGRVAASLVAVVLRAGIFPLHGGIAELCDRASRLQLQQLITLPVLIFAHVRFVDHVDAAQRFAIPIVVVGSISMLAFGIVSLAQRTLPGLLRASTFMHGGMLVAAVGAAGRGHYAAALIVAMTMALSLTGCSLILNSFEARVGSLDALALGGQSACVSAIGCSAIVFGGAAVGLPGTAGFIADDLLLHALWSESVVSAVMMMIASALLAVATFATFARAFLGAPIRQLAPDLRSHERGFAILLVVLLVLLGTIPSLVVYPASVLLSKV